MNAKDRIQAISLATILILSIGASTILIPDTTAHTPAWEIKTFAYVTAYPEIIGQNQSTLIYMWLDKTFPGADMQNDYRFHNYRLTITKPDGSVETKDWPRVDDTTSSQSYNYKADMVGTYTLNFTFLGNKVSDFPNPGDAYTEDTYLPSTATGTFTVVAETLEYLPSSYPLPTEYWTRPIYGENSMWFTISSDWLGTGAAGYGGFAGSYNYGGNGALFGPDTQVGPLTGHVMWTKPLQAGGVVGGDSFDGYEGNTYFEGSAYLQRYSNPIIVNGKLYYTEPVSYLNPSSGPTKCVDLRTGEVIWSRTDVPALSFAYIMDPENPNQHGVMQPILFTSNFARAFDADTGNPLFNVTNVPSGRKAAGPMGEQLIYAVTNVGSQFAPNWTLTEWNSSKLWTWTDTPSIGTSIDGSTATNWVLNLDWANPPNMPNNWVTMSFGGWTFSYLGNPFTIVEAIPGDMLLCYNGTLPSTGSNFFMGSTITYNPYNYFAINIDESKGAIGSIRWRTSVNAPIGNVTVLEAGVDPVNRVFVENLRETQSWRGFDLDNGKLLWTTKSQAPMDYYGSPASGSLANCFGYGKMYSSAYAGIVYCYDTKTGNLLWTYGDGGAGNSTNSGWAVPGHYPTFVNAIGSGCVYTVTTEHTIETPLYKGSLFRALNATTGEEVWTLNGYVGEFMTTSYAIADGYATWFNGLDNRVYVVGKGPSQTTITAPDMGLASGQSVVIRGRVTDIASGTTEDEQSARFPSGVPVASDASMKDWMGYVYQQKPLPTNFTGVAVTINVVDGNGNFRSIGTTTTDETGMYSLSWLPDISGDYQVIASFAGTNGYWPSSAKTTFVVDPAPDATPAPTEQPKTMADLYFLPAIIGLFIAIIVVGLMTILILRKRP